MTEQDILQAFKEKVCREVEIEQKDLDRYVLDQCRNATITVYHFEKLKSAFFVMVVYENQEALASRALAQISDVVGKQFSSLGQSDRIKQFIKADVLGE